MTVLILIVISIVFSLATLYGLMDVHHQIRESQDVTSRMVSDLAKMVDVMAQRIDEIERRMRRL